MWLAPFYSSFAVPCSPQFGICTLYRTSLSTQMKFWMYFKFSCALSRSNRLQFVASCGSQTAYRFVARLDCMCLLRLCLLRESTESKCAQASFAFLRYYRCIGPDAYRFGGVRLCWNKQLRTDLVDEAVWEEVRRLLEHREQLEQEYRWRLLQQEQTPEGLSSLQTRIGRLRQGETS
jgi:hypothetical protein